MHEMAASPDLRVPVDAGDVANSHEEFILPSAGKPESPRERGDCRGRKDKAYVLEVSPNPSRTP